MSTLLDLNIEAPTRSLFTPFWRETSGVDLNIENASRALDLGIDIVNDVSASIGPFIKNSIIGSSKKIVIMHNLGMPADPKFIIDTNQDVIEDRKSVV